MNSARGIRAAFRAGERSATEIVESTLEAVENDGLGSFWTVVPERALARAAELDVRRARNEKLGPLAGVPFAAKDCFDIAGLPTRCGIAGDPLSPTPDEDADAVRLLESNGAVLVGKTSMDQLAWGMKGESPGFPTTHNPVDPTRMPGGSSGGSAVAVASGLVPIALGTDAGGSVRLPAAWCGIQGFKPTLGSVPTGGCAPMAPSLDTVGVLARSTEDAHLALEALVEGIEKLEAPSAPRVGVMQAAFEGADPEVARACDAALRQWESNGAILVDFDLPWLRRGLGSIYAAELAASWTELIEPSDERLLPTVRAGLEHGYSIDAVSYLRASRSLDHVRVDALEALESVDVVAGPTSPIVAPPLIDPDATPLAGRNTRVFNGLGWPSVSVPVSASGMPVGLQLATAGARDSELLSMVSRLSGLTGF